MKRLIIIILIKIVIIFIISSIIEVMLPIYKTMMNFEKQTSHRFYIFIYIKDKWTIVNSVTTARAHDAYVLSNNTGMTGTMSTFLLQPK